MANKLLLIFCTLAIVAGLIYAFMPQPIRVDLATVSSGPLVVRVEEDGRTRIKENYIVSAPLAGRLMRIQLEAGDPVESGETLLAVIQPTDPSLLDPRALAEAEARVRAAEASLRKTEPALERALAEMEYAELELGRAKKAFAGDALSEEDLEEHKLFSRAKSQDYRAAKFAQEIAQFELEMANAALLRTQPRDDPTAPEPKHNGVQFEIRAPISGRVLRVFQESATVVTPGMQLLELGDPTDLEVEVDVLSSDAVKIEPGAKVLLENWGGDEPILGRVRLVEPSAFMKISALGVEEQRVNIIIDLVDPREKWKALGDAFRVEAGIIIWESDHVLRVPTSALFRYQKKWSVFLIEDDRAVLKPVEIGQRNGLEAEVLGGLSENDRVIVHPSDRIEDGVAVVQR